MEEFPEGSREGPQKIKDRRHSGKAQRKTQHQRIIFKKSAAEGQKNQYDGQRIKEHQHRHGIGDDGVQSQIGDQKGQDTEADGPDPVGRTSGKQLHKGFPAAGDQSHRRFQAGHSDGNRQDRRAGPSEIMLRDLCQRLASVGRHIEQPPALGAHHGHQRIDQSHQKGTEKSRQHCIFCHFLRFFHTQAADGMNHDNTESQSGQSIHGVIALQKAGEKCLRLVSTGRSNLGNRSQRRDQRPQNQNGKKDQKQRIQHLSDPGENFSRPKGEKKHRDKKDQREDGQRRALIGVREHPLDAHRIGNRGTSGDGEKRSDGKIQGAGEKQSKGFSYPSCQFIQTVLAADAESGHSQKRQPHAGDEKARGCQPHVPSCQLPHGSREDKITRSEKHAEQHACHGDDFLKRQFLHVCCPHKISDGLPGLPCGRESILSAPDSDRL